MRLKKVDSLKNSKLSAFDKPTHELMRIVQGRKFFISIRLLDRSAEEGITYE